LGGILTHSFRSLERTVPQVLLNFRRELREWDREEPSFFGNSYSCDFLGTTSEHLRKKLGYPIILSEG
jgi:hypothetical protein